MKKLLKYVLIYIVKAFHDVNCIAINKIVLKISKTYLCEMFKCNYKGIVLVLFALLMLASVGCKSKFERLRASTDPGRKYEQAREYFNKRDFIKARDLLEDLLVIYRGTDRAEDVYYYYAYSHFGMKDLAAARFHFKTFADTYPNSRYAEECRYMAAFSLYRDSPVHSLDQQNTILALEAFQLFINIYPTSERVSEANTLMDELRAKLELKSFENAKLYFTIGDYKSAVVALKNSMRDYPDTPYREEMEFLIVKSHYFYARNSIEARQEERYRNALDAYIEFAEVFPSSAFMTEATEIKNDAEKKIEAIRNNITKNN